MHTELHVDRSHIHQIVLVYAVVAAIWILLSDQAVEWLFRSAELRVLASTLKGWLFIAVTSLLLYTMLRRTAAPSTEPQATLLLHHWWPLGGMALLIVLVTVLGVTYTISEEQGKEIARIQAIATLKSHQIADRLQERQSDAELLMSSPVYAELYRRWQQGGDLRSRDQLLNSLQQLLRVRGYSAISLFNRQGVRLWGSAAARLNVTDSLRGGLQQVWTSRQVQRVGPYLNTDQQPSLDFLAPLQAEGALSAVVVLHTASSDWLNPILKTWPVASRSGETLLFRRVGSQVLYLNDLRHLKKTALHLYLPLSDKQLLAAQLLRGDVRQNEVVVGLDYRHEPVLGVVRAIPTTDWFLLAKMDRSELYLGALRHASWLGLCGVLALFVAASLQVMLHLRAQLLRASQERQSQGRQIQSLQLLAAVADSSEDPIFAKDLAGRYMLFNRAACTLIGKTQEQVLGQDDTTLFPLEQAEKLQQFGRQVLADDCVCTCEELLSLPSGDRVFLATKGPLKGEDGQCIGTFGISRDITERNAAEKVVAQQTEELRQRNAELERMNQAMVGRELEMIALKRELNQIARLTGRSLPYVQADLADLDPDNPSAKDGS
jgi:PAS domain S-box-containing protein